MPVAPVTYAASAAATGFGETAMSAVPIPNSTLVRARNSVLITCRRAIQSEPVSDPMLNTVVMKA